MRKTLATALLVLAGCKQAPPPAPVYQAVPVEHRDIIVSARANGTIQPDTTVEVKSQASGEVLEVRVETGQLVRQGDLVVRIDPRIPRNNVEQAKANLEVAQAKQENAKAQLDRATELFKTQSITQTEFESAQLDYATAKAGVVSAQVALQNAQITLDQTDVRAPITGTVIELDVERGQVISSPISNVGEGTVLMRMADLNRVQVSTLVDETDIGKITPGLLATVTVDAYPNRPFDGSVIKIEPLATTQQNVTMFPVLVRIQNREGLLKPGMNADVEIHVGRRDGVLAVPVNALRTPGDVSSAAEVLGLSMDKVQQDLAQATPQPAADPGPARAGGDSAAHEAPASGNTMTLPNGRVIPLPAGVTEAQVRAIFQKRMSGEQPTDQERAILRKVFQGMGGRGAAGGGAGARQPAAPDTRFGGRYIVFVRRGGETRAVNISTGLSDLDYSEVVSGLTDQDSVLILPSASLVQSQQQFKERIQRVAGGGIPGMSNQSKRQTPARGGQ
jgi:HlyD family secretion protein